MRDYTQELERRVAFIRHACEMAGAQGVVFGNSGGKDSALVGILCQRAVPTVGIVLPCSSQQNYHSDREDALAVAAAFSIETRTVDLGAVRAALLSALEGQTTITDAGGANIAPRLRMTALYAVAASENRLVAGTGNRSERHMGYFTKWGDGACDFNPIADLTVTEIYEFLRFLKAPASVLEKPPSGGLFDGQTDEAEMGIGYAAIDRYLMTGEATAQDRGIIERYHRTSEHKRTLPLVYEETARG